MTQLQSGSASAQPSASSNRAGFWVFMLAMSVFPIILVLLYAFNS